MTDLQIEMRDLRASIDDVRPIMLRAGRAGGGILSHARVECDGHKIFFQATDRFVALDSKFFEFDEFSPPLMFSFMVDEDTLKIIKSLPVSSTATINRDGFVINGMIIPAVENDAQWPPLRGLIDGAWDDADYFTLSDKTGPTSFDPHAVKHVKSARIIPRINDAGKASRIEAEGRVKGVLMPVRLRG